MAAYYNEIDPYAAEWLRNLIRAGLIAPGDVDVRSIRDVHPVDLIGYTQCHFFAGIGVWSYALRLAGWPDDRPVWTGSCPCQPFSAAGQQAGFDDDRHLWPDFFRLIDACVPRHIFGEQVASKVGLAWLDLVHADLEGENYTVRAADTCAAGFGAPHIRQRLYFVAASGMANADGGIRCEGQHAQPRVHQGPGESEPAGVRGSEPRKLADPNGRDARAEGLQRGGEHGQQPQDGGAGGLEHAPSDGREQRRAEPGGRGAAGGCGEGVVGDTDDPGSQGRSLSGAVAGGDGGGECLAGAAGSSHIAGEQGPDLFFCGENKVTACFSRGPVNGFWRDADWLPCIDGKARPVEPGTFPLAHGAPARVGRLRAYGNAINAEQAAEFIAAAWDQFIGHKVAWVD